MSELIGVGHRFYQKLEKAQKGPSVETLYNTAKAFNVPMEMLITGKAAEYVKTQTPPTVDALLEVVRKQEAQIKDLESKLSHVLPELISAISKYPLSIQKTALHGIDTLLEKVQGIRSGIDSSRSQADAVGSSHAPKKRR